jgi:hypothetical protein
MDRSTLRLVRAAAITRSAWGAALLLHPRPILVSSGDRPVTGSVVVARVLGARQVAQGLITAAVPTPTVLATGVAVDALHAATAVGLALLARRWRTVARTDAIIATALAGVGCRLSIRARRRP